MVIGGKAKDLMHRAHSARRGLIMAETMLRLHPDDIELLAKKIVSGMVEAKAMPEKLIGIDELATITGVPKGTLYQYSHQCETNGFPCSKKGKVLRFKASEVQGWLKEKPLKKKRR